MRMTGFWSRVWGRGCDEAEISEEKRLFTEWGPGIQWMKALVRNSTGKAIQWRGFGPSVNRWTLKILNFVRSSPSPNLRSYGWKNLLGQKSCRTKVSRIFRFFVPNFSPNFSPNFPWIFWGVFVLHFVGDGDQKKFTKNPRHFSMQNSQANSKKKSTKCFWRAVKVRTYRAPSKGHREDRKMQVGYKNSSKILVNFQWNSSKIGRNPHTTPHKIDNQHRECKTGGGAYFAFFLGSKNSHTASKIPSDEEGLLWGWRVVGGPL